VQAAEVVLKAQRELRQHLGAEVAPVQPGSDAITTSNAGPAIP
jgi:hypothetical protein